MKNDIKNLKRSVQNTIPNVNLNFVKLPLPPVLCKLPGNNFISEKDRTSDILLYNDFIMSLNDRAYELSLQDEGIISPLISGFEYWNTPDKMFCTGRTHDRSAWRRREPMPKAMHLADHVRKKFWNDCIEFYFDHVCE